LQVDEQFIEPISAAFISRLAGDQTERVQLAVAGAVDLMDDRAADCRIGGKQIGHLQTSQIEGLARGGAGDRDCGKFRPQVGKHLVPVTRVNEIGVNFVGDDPDIVTEANLAQLFQFRARPYTTDWIVWAAENEQLDLVGDNFGLEIGKIDAILTVCVEEFVDNQTAVIIAHDGLERVINGLAGYHASPG